MTTFILIYAGLLGAIAGSFVTAWVWRVRVGKSMLDKHSQCPQCHHALGPKDLIPMISWLLQRGRCRYCQAKISIQYPLIELATATLFVAMAYRMVSLLPTPYSLFQPWPLASLLFAWVMIVILVALFVYDLHWYELPNIWTLGGAGLSLLMLLLAAVFKQPVYWQTSALFPTPYSLLPTLLSGLMAAAFFWLIVWGSEKLLHKQGMGEGDIKLALLMGLFLGFPTIVVAIYLAFVLGAVLSLLLIAGKQKSWGQHLPFGPFLIVGTVVALFISPTIVSWYLQLLI